MGDSGAFFVAIAFVVRIPYHYRSPGTEYVLRGLTLLWNSYNSAVFTSTSSNNYAVFSVDHGFLASSDSANTANYANVGYLLRSGIETSKLSIPISVMVSVATSLRHAADAGNLVNLTTKDCITEYTKPFQSTYRNVFLVSDQINPINLDILASGYLGAGDVLDNNASDTVSFLYTRFYSDFTCSASQAFDWTCIANGTVTGPNKQCDPACDDPSLLQRTVTNSTWAPLGPEVSYCLAEKTETQCILQFSMAIGILVVVLNAVKLTVMALTVFFAFDSKDPPLLTMGDAVASFLDTPDRPSKGMCLITASKIRHFDALPPLLKQRTSPVEFEYPGHITQRWSRAVTSRRWFFCLILYTAALCTAAGFLGTGLNAMSSSKSLSSLWSIGFGIPSSRTLVQNDATESGKASLMSAVALANIPQLVLSLLYFTYNGLFTCMLLAYEWNSYATYRKGLRISSSHPQGAQRSGYFLQLPYRFSVPLVIFSLLFHWLISQSIFVVNINMLDYLGRPITNGANYVGHLVTCGYSPIAIIFSILLGSGLVAALLGFGLGMRLKSGMPMAGSCSLSIAAACHSTPLSMTRENGEGEKNDDDVPESQQKLMWGVIPSSASQISNDRNEGLPSSKPLPQIPLSRAEPTTDFERATLLPPNQHNTNSQDLSSLLPQSAISPDINKWNSSTHIREAAGSTPNEEPTSFSSLLASHVEAGGGAMATGLGHCGFSAGPVERPVKGLFYA